MPGDAIQLDGCSPADGVALDGVGGAYATTAGILFRGNGQVRVENMQKRYLPRLGDCVVGAVVYRTAEAYKVDIKGPAAASLPVLAFNGATKRNRPLLEVGALIFARVEAASPDLDTELSCTDPSTRKSWNTGEVMFGELKGRGLPFEVPLAAADRLLQPRCFILSRLGKNFKFELCIGQNGRIWLRAMSARDTVMLMTAIRHSFGMSDVHVEAMVSKMCQDLQ